MRRFESLHDTKTTGSTETADEYEPLDEELDKIASVDIN